MTKDKTAGAVFSDWISTEVRPFLSARGWRRTGLVFEKADGANSGLIAFRRWKWNTHDTCRFFVEAGVFSPRLAREEADWAGLPVPMTPTLRLGAIGARLAALMGEREELFWTVRASSLALELEALGESVREKIEIFVLPFVEAHASDEAIRDQLLAHLDDLGPEQVRWLTRLLADLGPRTGSPRSATRSGYPRRASRQSGGTWTNSSEASSHSIVVPKGPSSPESRTRKRSNCAACATGSKLLKSAL